MKTDYDQYTLSKKEKTQFLVVGGLIVFGASFLFYHSFIFSLAAVLPVYALLPLYQKQLAKKRKQFLTTQFKDVLYSLSASVEANRQLAEGLSEALTYLRQIYGEETPMVAELRHMVKDISENRRSDINLLIEFAERSHCEDITNFVQVYKTCRAMGGDMGKVLKNSTEILIDKMNIEREIKTQTAQKKFEGKLISGMPIIVILFLNLFSPDYLMPLYTTAAGRLIMTLAIAGIGGAYYLTDRLTDIEI